MTEAVQDKMGPIEERQTPDGSRLAVFEPEVLAFCCEH